MMLGTGLQGPRGAACLLSIVGVFPWSGVALAAMGPRTAQPVEVGDALPQDWPQSGLRDTGECDPPVGGPEPMPCTTNGDCAGYGPETCTGGFCDYPPPTPCTTNSECEGLGTGWCLTWSEFICDDQHYHYCPMGTDEGEWTLPDSWCGIPDDSYNGGCLASGGPAFSSIACGETVCGTSMNVSYMGSPSSRRDEDWYRLVITEPTKVTVSGRAEMFYWIIGVAENHGVDNCDDWEWSDAIWSGHYASEPGCEWSEAEACLHPGIWWVYMIPQWSAATECQDYVLTVECESPCSVPCCMGNDVCVETDHDTCEVSGGVLLPFESCIDAGAACTYGCPGAEFPCNTEQTIDNTVNSTTALPPMSCATGDSSGLFWWWFTAESDSVQISTCNSDPGLGGDSVFALYEGDCLNTLTEIACSEDTDCGPDNWLGITCTDGLVVGDTYYIQFASWDSTSQGTYLVQVECPCPDYALGACCLSDGSCLTATFTQCATASGSYHGPDTTCAGDLDSNGIDDACAWGACCMGGTDCLETSVGWCTGNGGLDFFGDATCNPNPCQGACCRLAGIPPSWQCTDLAEVSCTGDWYDGEQCSQFDCAACYAQAVRSLKDHGAAGELSLDTGVSGGIEPRLGGVTKLEIDLDDGDKFSGGVTVTCTNAGDVSGSVGGTSVAGDTVTIDFSQPLPDQDACTVELDCGATTCVRTCEGDLNRSGGTTVADNLQAKIRFGQVATNANAEWDFNLSGGVSTSDALQIKIRFGFAAPECP